MKSKRLIFVLSVLMTMVSSLAHTVVWQMKPSKYSSIERINENLYKVNINGKIGLIHSDGEVVAEPENDELTLFHEHCAIMTQTDGHGLRVKGCLTDDGVYSKFENRYYVLKGQGFYSDGLLSVSDANGKVGYIDTFGNAVIGFDEKYDRIKPFVEGYAAVFNKKDYSLINKNGIPVKFRFKGVGKVNGGTNVCNGKVYVWDNDGKFYTFDVTRGGVCKSAKKPSDTQTVDYLYRFACVSGESGEVPFVSHTYNGQVGLSPMCKDGRFGYFVDDDIVLPHQLISATNFEDGLAVVETNGNLGILKYVSDETFSVSLGKDMDTHNFYDKENITCGFNLQVPRCWRGKDITVVVTGEDGFILRLDEVYGVCSFNVVPEETCSKNFSVTIFGEGLKLYETDLKYSFVKKYKCAICGKDTDLCRGHETPKQVVPQTQKEDLCPTCGKTISQCKYDGVH